MFSGELLRSWKRDFQLSDELISAEIYDHLQKQHFEPRRESFEEKKLLMRETGRTFTLDSSLNVAPSDVNVTLDGSTYPG